MRSHIAYRTIHHRSTFFLFHLTEDSQFQSAMEACAVALKRMASYELNATLRQRRHELGERLAYLSPDEHEQLLDLVEFARKRTVEKLEA